MIEFNLYDGEVTLIFDPHEHIYYYEGEPVPSVTTILHVQNKPFLNNWKLKLGIEYLRSVLRPGMNEVEIEQALRYAEIAHEKDSDLAKDIGTVGHDWIERYVKSKIYETEKPELPEHEIINWGIQRFLLWEEKAKPLWLESERKIFLESMVILEHWIF